MQSHNPEDLIARNEKFFFAPTRFEFIQAHKGFRPGAMHMLLAPISAGKSSLTRSILADVSQAHRVLFLSTEETEHDFRTQCAYLKSPPNFENISWVDEDAILAEIGQSQNLIADYVRSLDWHLAASRAEILFFDNVTVSKCHREIKLAEDFACALRVLMVARKIPFYVVGHTASNVKEGVMFESSDIRGNRTLAIKAEYLYCMARFASTIDDHTTLANFIRVDKSRAHEGARRMYRMWFDPTEKHYTASEFYDYDRFIRFANPRKRKS
jgi:hypothetical protein